MFQERNLNKTGAGISYRRDFDTFKDFFDYRREKRRKKAEKLQLKKDAQNPPPPIFTPPKKIEIVDPDNPMQK